MFLQHKKYTSTNTQVPPSTIPKAGFANKQIASKYANSVQTKKCSLALKLQPYNTTRRNIHRRGKMEAEYLLIVGKEGDLLSE